MKKLILSTIVVLMAGIACHAATVIDEIKKIDDITAYHVPRFLIKNVLGMNGIIEEVMPGTSISALRDVESIDFIMAHKGGAKKKVRKQVAKLAKDPAYEIIMQAKKDKKRNTVVYGLPLGEGDYKEVIIIVDEDDNITIIDVIGTLNIDELSRIAPAETEEL